MQQRAHYLIGDWLFIFIFFERFHLMTCAQRWNAVGFRCVFVRAVTFRMACIIFVTVKPESVMSMIPGGIATAVPRHGVFKFVFVLHSRARMQLHFAFLC